MKYNTTTKSRRLSKRRIALFSLIMGVVFVCCSLVGVRMWYSDQLEPRTSTSKQITVTIESGSSAADIAKLLQEKGVIKSSWAFERYVASNNLRELLQAGTYDLDSAYSIPQVADAISNGKVQRGLFTILPGLRLDQIRSSMVKAGFEPTAVDKALDASAYKNHPALVGKPDGASLEGYLYPESYERITTTTPEDIVRQALDEMAKILAPDRIEQFSAQGLSPFRAITLASIVLKESSNADQQKTIASVFYNRLHKNIPLGSDVTYQYASDILGVERDGTIDSPYNTRLHAGLPPGPIANVTASSLEAVAHPAQTDYLFFVAGDDGKVYFSRTQEEHERLAQEHCKVLCATY